MPRRSRSRAASRCRLPAVDDFAERGDSHPVPVRRYYDEGRPASAVDIIFTIVFIVVLTLWSVAKLLKLCLMPFLVRFFDPMSNVPKCFSTALLAKRCFQVLADDSVMAVINEPVPAVVPAV